MQASTWQSTPRAAAAAAISATGSITPWAYEGAEATTSAVRSVERGGHGGRVGAEGDGVDGDDDRFDAQVGGGLVEGGVGGGRQHQLGCGDPAYGPGVVAGGLDGEQDALRAAAGERALGAGGAEQGGDRADHVVLQPGHAREDRGVEPVDGRERGVRLGGQLVEAVAAPRRRRRRRCGPRGWARPPRAGRAARRAPRPRGGRRAGRGQSARAGSSWRERGTVGVTR